jgi:hypothetical protein
MTVSPKSGQETALCAVEKALALLRSAETLQKTDKDTMEYLLEVAADSLRREAETDRCVQDSSGQAG